MRLLHLALPIFILAHVGLAMAQDIAEPYDGIPDAVIKSIGKKDIKGMFQAMAKTVKLKEDPDDTSNMLDAFSGQLLEQLKDTGDFIDADLYREEHFGQRYSVLTYIVNYANKPVGVKIKMYDGKKGWRASNVNFMPDIDKFVSDSQEAPKKTTP